MKISTMFGEQGGVREYREREKDRDDFIVDSKRY